MNYCCSCGTYSVGRCVECGSEKCANHSRLVESRRLCNSCEKVFRVQEDAKAQRQRTERNRNFEELMRLAAIEIGKLKDDLMRSSIETTTLRFTTTKVMDLRPMNELGPDVKQNLLDESRPEFGQFERWVQVRYLKNNFLPGVHRYAVCCASGCVVNVVSEGKFSGELWIDNRGVMAWPERLPDWQAEYPKGVPAVRVIAADQGDFFSNSGYRNTDVEKALRSFLAES